MNGDGPGTPPPFSQRRSGRNGDCGDSRRSRNARADDHGMGHGGESGDWAEDYLGKPRGMSWSAYLGLGQFTNRRGPRHDDGYPGPADGGGARSRDADPRVGRMENEAMGRVDPYYRSPNPNRLFRNAREGKIGGVCAGIADYFNIDTAIVRVGFVLGLIFFPPVFFMGYLVLWWILKPRPTQLFETREDEVFWRSVTTKPDQTLSGLRSKFRTLEQELSAMEGYVASPEFSLNRQFKDLEKR